MTSSVEVKAPAHGAHPEGNVIHHPAGTGPTTWFGDAIYTFKATKDNTNGSLTFAEASVPPGGGPPPHIHPHADEAFFILSGEIEFLNGEKTFIAREGDFVFVPRGTRHRFRNVGLHVSRLLFLFTPGGMESFFTEIGQEARAGEAPQPFTPEQRQQIIDNAPRHDLHLAP
ncbi:cupin domain-containing protein [Kitasatospora sp. NBC_01287]|uniref:cupin domain-containing protein n=1 Tax=Kitasatospora sp. NBC_01287 TaxID=2903573 RepID=UPI002253B11B|nr:cupin domain-containing protein [Kitasatospora sp. NBC_01287]MCX4746153.1 cupin domain-containing protein [Kitasatospora sp. NBC_01287]